MWDLGAGELCHDLVFCAAEECVTSCPDSEMVALGTCDGLLRCMNWKSGQCLFEYITLDHSAISSMQSGTDGTVLVCGNALGESTSWSTSDTLSSDRSRVATATHDSMIRVWDTTTGSTIVEYPTHADGCCCLALNSDGTKIASASPNGAILIWNSAVAPCASDITFTVDASIVSCLSLSPDGSKVLTCLADQVQVWELATKQKLGSRCSACFARPCCLALEV